MTQGAGAAEFPPAPWRHDPPYVAGERTMLDAWLDFHRATLLVKCDGLNPDQLRQRCVEPSTLSLLGLVRHMSEVERSWFRRTFAGQDAPPLYYSSDHPDADLHDVDSADTAKDLAAYRAEVDACRNVVAGADLDALGQRRRHGQPVSLRWIYLHMIEEYARHNGHADLLRQRLDGTTGQ